MSRIYVGIVGSGADKFTPETEQRARQIIRKLLRDKTAVLVSGHSPVGGIDIWAEEEARKLHRPMEIFPAEILSWLGEEDKPGYKERNLSIANLSDVVNVIVPMTYPPGYSGFYKFLSCYHCHTDKHIKSGACWTAKHALHAKWWVL